MNIPGARSPTLLPDCFVSGTIGKIHRENGLTHGHDLTDEASMETFAVSGETPFAGGFAPPGGLVAQAWLPGEAPQSPRFLMHPRSS
jgi:hypothetical protein